MDKVIVGKVGAPYGVRGWVKIYSFTEPLENIFTYPLFIESRQGWLPVQIDEFKAHGDAYVAKLASVEDRDQAALITNAQLGVAREQLPDLDDGEYYWADLIGLVVYNQDNLKLGMVVDVFATGANDVIVVQDEGREHLIPYVPEMFVVEVDVAQKIMRVTWEVI